MWRHASARGAIAGLLIELNKHMNGWIISQIADLVVKHAMPSVCHRSRWQLTAFLWSLRLFRMRKADHDMNSTFDLLWHDENVLRPHMTRISCSLDEFRFEKTDSEVRRATFVQHMRRAKEKPLFTCSKEDRGPKMLEWTTVTFAVQRPHCINKWLAYT